MSVSGVSDECECGVSDECVRVVCVMSVSDECE